MMDFEVCVPGAFIDYSTSPICPALTRTTAHSSSRSMFITPLSPSASSSLSHSCRAVSRHREDSNAGSRKRPRLDIAATNSNAPQSPRGYFSHSNFDLLSASDDALSPYPLVNTDYRLAGGLDTPRRTYDNDSELDSNEDYRMSRFAPKPDDCFTGLQTPVIPGQERNGRKRGYDRETSPRALWEIGRTVWALTGGAATKVITFCWSTGKAFTGFRAGGGTAYQLDQSTPGFADQSWTAVDGKEDVFNADYCRRSTSPIPGGFPGHSFIEDYMANPYAHQLARQDVETPTLLGKTTVGSSMKSSDNWIFVKPSEGVVSRDASPTRKKQRAGTGHAYSTRLGSRASIAMAVTRPKLTPSRSSDVTNASFASPRASGAYVNARPPSSEGPTHRRSRSSIAFTRRETLPPSPEVLQFEKDIRRKEKVVDRSMQRLNSQLQDMIREGKEALGTKIEVRDVHSGTYDLDLVEDEGYAGSDTR